MKLVKLQGGLGNQMFQYAVARALEIDQAKKVYLDLTYFEENKFSKEGFTTRVYELDIFSNLRARILNKNLRRFLLSEKGISKILQQTFGLTLNFMRQKENEFVQMPKDAENLYIEGFFQSEKYFRQIKPNLINDFKFPALDSNNSDLKLRMEAEDSVSIHIRRGDYIKSKIVKDYHGVLDIEYYKRAIACLQQKTDKSLRFYLFSEDEEYIRAEFSFLNSYCSVGSNNDRDSWKDMCLMKSCKHHIIANSSFSWWGAWLSERNGVIVAPNDWFNRKNVSFDITDFVPEEWILI